VEVDIKLFTKQNAENIKGLDGTFGVIVDDNNNIVCVAPLDKIDFVFECLLAEARPNPFFSPLSSLMVGNETPCTNCNSDGVDVTFPLKRKRRKRASNNKTPSKAIA